MQILAEAYTEERQMTRPIFIKDEHLEWLDNLHRLWPKQIWRGIDRVQAKFNLSRYAAREIFLYWILYYLGRTDKGVKILGKTPGHTILLDNLRCHAEGKLKKLCDYLDIDYTEKMLTGSDYNYAHRKNT